MEHRIEHPIRPFDFVGGKTFDFLNQGVTVALAFGQEREDERFGGSGDQFFVSMAALYIALLCIARTKSPVALGRDCRDYFPEAPPKRQLSAMP